ncbi:hypothetical protein LHK79_18250, partial [Escherichia coli]|nr:hypothetical protein [Escherichia coli]
TGGTADRNRSHWSTSKTPSYTKSVSWQHHLEFAVNNGNIDAKSKLQELKKLKRMDRRKNKENP